MGKFKMKKYLKTFIAMIILMMSLLTGKVYARDGVVNNWYVINKEYTTKYPAYINGMTLNDGYWCNWANYCSQNGVALGSLGLSPEYTGLVARPDEAFVLSCIANFAYNPNVPRGTLSSNNIYGVLNDTDDWSEKADPYRESLLSSYSNGKDGGGYGYIQYAWWCTLAGKSMPQTNAKLYSTSALEESSTVSPVGTVDTVYESKPEEGLFEVVTDKSASSTKEKTLSTYFGKNEYIGQFDELSKVEKFLEGKSTYKGDFYLHIYDDKLDEKTEDVIKKWFFTNNSSNPKEKQWNKDISIQFITKDGEDLNNYYISFEYIGHATEDTEKGMFKITNDNIDIEKYDIDTDNYYNYKIANINQINEIKTYLETKEKENKYNKSFFQLYVYDEDFVLQDIKFYFVNQFNEKVDTYDKSTDIIFSCKEALKGPITVVLGYMDGNNPNVIKYSNPEKKAEGLWGIASAYRDFIKEVAYKNGSDILYDEVEFDVPEEPSKTTLKYKRNGSVYKEIEMPLSENAKNSRDNARDVFGSKDLPTLKIPSIDIEKLFNCNDSNSVVSFNGQMRAYKIGPFSFDYEERVLTDNTGNKVILAGLDRFEIYGNNGLIAHADSEEKDGWYYQVSEKGTSDYNYDVYPPSGSDKEVYIVIPYEEGLTEIKEIRYNYNLLRVGANYDLYTGSGQNQAYVKEAARWTESIAGTIAVSNMADIEIEKKAVDENSKELTLEELKEKLGDSLPKATFKVTVHYKDKVENQIVQVEAGNKEKVSFPYEEGATFDAEEIEINEGIWKTKSINDQNGNKITGQTLQANNTVEVIATNQLVKHEGQLKIVKKLIDGQKADEDTTFKFKVTINSESGALVTSSTGKYSKDSFTDEVTLTVKKGDNQSDEKILTYTWYGDEAPTYTVTEDETQMPKEYEKVNIIPDNGTLLNCNFIYGDVNVDGKVDPEDSFIVERYNLGLETLTPSQKKAADVNNDGFINKDDQDDINDIYVGIKEKHVEPRVEVTATNKKTTITPVTLTLKKSIKDGVDPKEKFTFRVKTEGAINNFGNTTEYVPIVLDAGQEATFTFTPESATTPVKYWVYEEIASGSKTKPNEFIVSEDGEIIADSDETIANSSESIVKINIPATTPENGWYAIVEGKELTNGESVRVEAINEVTPTQGHLKLTKDFSQSSTKDRVATFKVTVEVPKEVNLEKLKIPDGFVQDTTTVYTSPDDAEATHYVTYITGLVNAGETAVSKWKTNNDIFNWDSNCIDSKTWDSGYFKWLGDYDIKYHIEEQQVFEVDLKNQKAENVTNQYTSVISTPDGNTEGRGKLYEDENLNLVHAYNGDKIVTLTVKKELDPNGKIDENKGFTFDVTVGEKDGVKVTKVITNNGSIDENGVFTHKPSVSVNNPVTYAFEYEGDEAPKFEVKETDNENLVSIDATNATGDIEDIKDENSDKVIGKKGSLNPGAEVTVTAKNKLKNYKNIAITKTISGPADTDEVFVFEVTVDGKAERAEITIKKGETTGETWTSKEYDCTDSKPKYSIKEIEVWSVDENGKHIDDLTGKYNPSITPNSGTLGDQVEHTIDVQAFNNKKTNSLPIQIKKTFKKELEKPVEVKVKVTVTAPEGGFTKVPNNFKLVDGKYTQEVSLKIGITEKEQSWKSDGNFEWNDDNYDLVQNTKVTEIEVLEDNGEENVIDRYDVSTKLDSIDGLPVWEIVNTEQKKGHITIKKTVEGKADTEEIFEFKVKVDNKEQTVYLKVNAGDEAASSYSYDKENWQELTDGKWISEEVKWKTTESAPSYSISEIHVEGYKPTFSSNDTSANYNEANQTYTGTLKADGIIDGTIDVDIQNNKIVNEKYAQLNIKKVVTGNTNKAKTFTFNVKVSGASNLQVVSGDSALIEQDGKNIEITNFTTDANNNTQFKTPEELVSETFKFKYTGDDAPTFEVTEAKGDDYKLESIASNAKDGTFTAEEGKYTGTLTGSDNENEETSNLITVVATNKVQYENNIVINKSLGNGPAGTNEIFKFDVTVTDSDGNTTDETAEIKVSQGKTTGTWTSKNTYTWYDENKAPTYEISNEQAFQADDNWNEVKNITEKYKPQGLPKEGTLNGNASEIKVDVVNYINYKKGSLQIKKELEKGQTTSEKFHFNILVYGNDNCKLSGSTNNEIEIKDLQLEAGQTSEVYTFNWVGSENPEYEIRETNLSEDVGKIYYKTNDNKYEKLDKSPNGEVSNPISGTLTSEENILVTVKNKLGEHKTNLTVHKEFYDSKTKSADAVKKMAGGEDNEDGVTFTVKVTIKGDFIYDNESNKEKVLYAELNKNNNWYKPLETVTWYGDKAPTIEVEEVDVPTGWKFVGMYINDSENKNIKGYTLNDKTDTHIHVINSLDETIKLTMQLGGMVWEDEDNLKEKPTNPGIYDEGEIKLKDIPVNIYKVITDNNGKEFKSILVKETSTKPFTSDTDIRWLVEDIPVPVVDQSDIGENEVKNYTASYDVEFEYNGQKYEPTDLLKYINTEKELTDGSAEKFRDGTNTERSYYSNSSMAKETENNSENITEIKGNMPIDDKGDTKGLVVYNNEEKEVTYHADNAGTSYPVISKLNTTTTDGIIDIFKSKATTKAAGLTFPFDGDICIGEDDKIVINVQPDETKFVGEEATNEGITTTYRAIYNYCKNINLGLVEKGDADAELEKRLTEAKVVVKEKMYQFKYNPNNPQDKPQQSALFKVIKDDKLAQKYAEMNKLQINVPKSDYYYRAEIYNSTVGYTLEDYYNNKFSKTYDDTEMDIYLTYEVIVRNVCDDYNFTINSIDDYYSADLELVKDSDKYKVIDGEKKKVADKFAYTLIEQPGTIQGSDGIMYKKITISNLGIDNLKPNEKSKAISMTFKVDKSRFDKTIKLGEKANVAEIASYSTKHADHVDNGGVYYNIGDNAGIIDRDSAPGNLNIKYLNDEKWYEDDTDSAFNVDIKLTGLYEEGNGTDRTIEGMVWEEKRTAEKDGYKYGNGQYRGDLKDNDEQVIKGITTELYERKMIPQYDKNNKIISYTSEDVLLQTDKPLSSLGGKTFEQVTEETKDGKTLKFDSTTTTDASGKYTFTGVPVGDYVVRFTYGDGNETKTTNYSTAKFYNGQDYKSSIYPNVDQIPTSLDLSKYNGAKEAHSNVAVDSEVRRLQVIQKSREITNKNGKVLAASHSTDYANKINEEAAKDGQNLTNKDILLKDYYMYAETPMISFDDLGKTYNLKNIDFAIEERPLTELSLDKQIKEILITTSDGKTLMDAVYNITYSINNEGKITANVELDETKSIGTENLQALDRDKSNSDHGFRYINVDSEVLQGTTITVTYQLSAINAGEVDYTGKSLAEGEWTAGKFHTVCDELSKKLATYNNDKKLTISQGTYVGHAYYYGTKGENDKQVTTSVKELVDYVDNDMTFDATLNSTQNTSWKTTTEFELKGLVENTGEIKDSNGTIFSTNGNLITSINDASKNDIVGKELETKRDEDSYKPEAQIQLTISKFVSADSDTLQIDNIAEIIRYTNTVGRRDILTTTGNTDPNTVYKTYKQTNPPTTISGGYVPTVYERDTSATELITLSPPTGSSIFIWRLQVAGAITAAMAIVAGGIILIKKKVLK